MDKFSFFYNVCLISVTGKAKGRTLGLQVFWIISSVRLMAYNTSTDGGRSVNKLLSYKRLIMTLETELPPFIQELKFIGRAMRAVADRTFSVVNRIMSIFLLRKFLMACKAGFAYIKKQREFVFLRVVRVLRGFSMADLALPCSNGPVQECVFVYIWVALRSNAYARFVRGYYLRRVTAVRKIKDDSNDTS